MFGGPKRAKAKVEADVLLMRRNGGLAQGVFLDERGIEGDLMGDETEQIIQELQRLLGGQSARESHKAHLIGEPQTVMGTSTQGNAVMIGRGENDAIGHDLTGIVQSWP